MKDKYYILLLLLICVGLFPFWGCVQNVEFKYYPEITTIKIADKVSDRASAYIDSNKIVRIGDVCYFVYLTADFEVIVESINLKTFARSAPYRIGKTEDNHGDPCIAVDERNYLYVMYGGHSPEIKFVHSARPADISAWVDDIPIRIDGRKMTYPVMNIYKDKIFVLLRTEPEEGIIPYRLTFFQKAINGTEWIYQDVFTGLNDDWIIDKDLGKIWNDYDPFFAKYSRFYANMNVVDGEIHIVFQCYKYLPRFIDGNLSDSSYCLGYLYSDNGISWKKSDGQLLTHLPVSPNDIDLITGTIESNEWPYYQMYNFVTNKGTPVVCYAKRNTLSSADIFISFLSGGRWTSKKVDIPVETVSWAEGAFSIAKNGYYQLLLPLTSSSDANTYGGKSTVLMYILFDSDGRVLFKKRIDNNENASKPAWLPNFEKSEGGGHSYLPKVMI